MTELVIEVKASTKDAEKAFKDFGEKIGDLAKKSENFSNTGKVAFGAFIGTLASGVALKAIDTLTDGLKELFLGSIKEAADAQQALHEFTTALQLSGNFTQKAVDDFAEYAQAIQRTTLFTDDAIIKNAAYIESLTNLDTEGLKKVSDASIQLATVLKIDLAAAGEILTRALTGNITALQRAGIVFEKTGDDAKDFETILSLINERWGGKAQAEVETYNGRVKSLGNSFGELQESLGKLFVDDQKSTGFIKSLTESFYSLADSINAIGESQEKQKIRMNIYNSQLENFRKYRPDIDILNESGILGSELGGVFQRSPDKEVAKPLTRSQIEQQEKDKKESIKIEEDRQKSIRDITERTLQFGLEGVQRIEAEKQKKINELITAYGGQAKVQQLNEAELLSFTKNRAAIEKEFFNNIRDENKKLADEEQKRYEANGAAVEKQISDLEEYRKKQAEITKEQNKQIENVLSGGLFDKTEIKNEKDLNPAQKAELERNKLLGGGIGIAQSLLGGESGAKELIVGGAKAVADFILPGLGKAIGPILDVLAQGPDAVKKFISDFVKSVPILITNLVEAIPAVGEALLEQVPILFDSLIASLPRVINSFIEKIPTIANALAAQSPFIAAEFAISFVKNIPYIVSSLASGAYNAIVNIFNQLNPFSSDSAAGGFVSDVGDFLGFAQGGYVKKVPNGFPNDSFPARLSEGEIVIDRSNAAKLESFLNNQGDNSGILLRILDAVSSPMTVESNVQVNQQTFANIILELSRQNRRLA